MSKRLKAIVTAATIAVSISTVSTISASAQVINKETGNKAKSEVSTSINKNSKENQLEKGQDANVTKNGELNEVAATSKISKSSQSVNKETGNKIKSEAVKTSNKNNKDNNSDLDKVPKMNEFASSGNFTGKYYKIIDGTPYLTLYPSAIVSEAGVYKFPGMSQSYALSGGTYIPVVGDGKADAGVGFYGFQPTSWNKEFINFYIDKNEGHGVGRVKTGVFSVSNLKQISGGQANSDILYANSEGMIFNKSQWVRYNGNLYYFKAQNPFTIYWGAIQYSTGGWSPGVSPMATAVIGWQTIDGNRYYFGSNGAAYTGYKEINGKLYKFNSDGKLQDSANYSVSINGASNKTISFGSNFDPMSGVTLNDPADPTAKITVSGKINTRVPGKYTFTYTVTDKYGKTARVERVIYVDANYNISINGVNNKTISYGSKFDPMAGVTLNDLADPTAKIAVSGEVNTRVPGKYTLTYTVTDKYGKTARVERVIHVEANYTVSINGTSNSTVSYGSKFDPMTGVTLNDPADPTAKIAVSGTVNTKVPGTYTLTYKVTDKYGKTVSVERTVTVRAENTWVTIGDNTYYYNNKGEKAKGLYTIDGNHYYFNATTGVVTKNSWVNVGSNGFKTDESVNGTTVNAYYFGSNGEAVKGLQTINGNIQYLNPQTGAMELNRFISLDGKTYYLKPGNGVVAKGLQTINGKIYDFNSTTGVMVTNSWETISGSKYYFGSNGEAYTGYKEIAGKVYSFNSEGKLQGEVSISINGASNSIVSYGSKFDPMTGVTLNDPADPTAKITVSGEVNTKAPGTYTLTYKVTDSFGQVATVERTVTVEANYTVSINGTSNSTVSYGSKFDPMTGVTLNDPADPTAKIAVSGEVNTKVPGKYTLTYTVTDKYGKTARVERVIHVEANYTVSINGVSNSTVSYGSKFDPMTGVTLNDPADPTAKIAVSGTVNTKVPGKYTVTYTVTDKYGKTARVERVIHVEANYTVSINGASNSTVSFGSKFDPMTGVTLNDLADPTAKIAVSGEVNTKVPGKYTLTYTVTDKYGKTARVERVIHVEANYTVSINGASNSTVSFGSKFDPMTGVTLNDPADPTAKIAVSGTVNTKVPGTYKLTYKVTDKYGKTASVERTITVRAENTWVTIGDNTYYYNNKGEKAKGLYTIDGNHYYFNATTGVVTKNTWVTVGSNGFKTDESVNGTTVNAYYFGSNGEALKGLQTINGNIQYLNTQTGAMELNRFINLDGKTYYLKPGNGVAAKGLQIIDGNIYYFNATSALMTTNSWVNIGSNGIKTDEPVNGTTVNAYYFGNNGLAARGFKTIGGNIQYFNPDNGVMELNKFIIVDGKTYYLKPGNGVAAKGLQTINGKIYDFNSTTGVMITNSWETISGSKYYFGSNGEAYTGYKEIAGKVYSFNSEGKLQGEVSISINGVSNNTVSYGSKFDPMTGVTLNDPADPTAKITVSGIVNTKVPGTYKLIYTVKDSFGQVATVERTVTVEANYNVSINGASNSTVSYGSKFDPMTGVTLNDPADPTAKVTVSGEVNTKVPGKYTLTYTVTDKYGKTARVERVIHVEANYTVSINGASNSTVSFGSKFDPMTGVTLNDPADPTAKIAVSGEVNTKVPGKYTLTYTVTDKYGKTARVERVIHVEANYTVSINGASNSTVSFGSKFDPMTGVTLNDPADPTAKITVSGEVNTKAPGTYKLTYKVIDKYGKTATVERTVTVEANYTVSINGVSNSTVSFGSNFDPMTGVTLNDPADPTAKVTVSGTVNTRVPGTYKLTYKVTDKYGKTATVERTVTVEANYNISINGVYNELIPYGSKFDPMAGVTLNDPADPTAKITVSGEVNIRVPGTYKLTYKVTDKYGKTVTVERNIIVQSNISTEYIDWSNGNLIINGNIELNNEIMKKSDLREVLIEDSNGNVVATANGAAVNWYSKNKENYSGFQVIFSKSELSKLESGKQYTFIVKAVVDGKTITRSLANTLALPNNSVYSLTTNSNNNLTIFKNSEVINSGVGTYEVGYFTNYGYVLNGNININGETLSKGISRSLLIKNSDGKVIYDIPMYSLNWYSKDKNNYSGFQGIITNSMLNSLKQGETYSFYIQVKLNGKTYEMEVNNTKGFILSSGINYNIATNSNNTITISKAPSYPTVRKGQGTFESGYWQSYGYVMNVKVNLGMNIPKGTKMQLISENELGQIVSVTPGIDVNWYGSSSSDYNGFQAMIIPKQLVEASPTNKLYARVIIDGKAYISPIMGNANIPIGSSGQKELNYGFKTIDGQVNLIMK